MPQDGSQRRHPEFVIIGRVRRAHGVRGVLRVEPMTDHPGRFEILKQVYLRSDEAGRTLFSILKIKMAGEAVLLTLEGIDSRETADIWRQAWVEIPGEDALPLPPGKRYLFELIGLRVVSESGRQVGAVQDIISYPWYDVYVVRDGEHETLIPGVAQIIVRVDDQRGVMIIRDLEGLLE